MFTHKVGDSDLRPWGKWEILAQGDKFQIKKITVNPEQRLSLQSNKFRKVNWLVLEGSMNVELDSNFIDVQAGEEIIIQVGQKHRPKCTSNIPCIFIEIQRGEYLGEDDIVRYEDDYGRI